MNKLFYLGIAGVMLACATGPQAWAQTAQSAPINSSTGCAAATKAPVSCQDSSCALGPCVIPGTAASAQSPCHSVTGASVSCQDSSCAFGSCTPAVPSGTSGGKLNYFNAAHTKAYFSVLQTYPIMPSAGTDTAVSATGKTATTQLSGTISNIKGCFGFRPDAPAQSSVYAELPVASLNTGIPWVNSQLMGKDYFWVDKYQTITFASTNVVSTGKNTADVTGNLFLRGVSKPITLHVTYNPGITTNAGNVAFSAVGTVNRSDFGINTYIGQVSNEVQIHIEAQGGGDVTVCH